ncbi:MAG: glutathione peroxidase, partial [Halieaceae bacterium]|nr:glutathione peroxidase [Halieaceae bacterium]
MTSVYDYSATLADGTTASLSDYKGQVLLIVNTASKCGFTPQYEGLEKLHATHKDAGFAVLAFPCNQFGSQEPGSTEEIVEFCEMRFQTSFPLFEKIDVNGTNSHPLYKHLKSEVKGLLGTERIKWNFTKFLINRDGEVVGRFGSQKKPA